MAYRASRDVSQLRRGRRRCSHASLAGSLFCAPVVFFGLADRRWWILAAVLLITNVAVLRASRAGAAAQTLLCTLVGALWVYSLYQFSTFLPEPTDRFGAYLHSEARKTATLAIALHASLVAFGLYVVVANLFATIAYRRVVPRSFAFGPTLARWRARAALPASRLLGIGLYGCMLVVPWALLGIEAISMLRASGEPMMGDAVLVLITAFAGVALKRRLVPRIKRLAAVDAAVARRADPRQPILFLRSFSDDQMVIERRLNPQSWRYGSVAVTELTLEEVIERALARWGPLVAIGRPAESLAPAGAAREYVQHGAWLERVREYVAQSRLVVVSLGRTEGLAAEYRTLRELGALNKILLVIPPLSLPELEWRWSLFVAATGLQPAELVLDSPLRVLVISMSGHGPPEIVTCEARDEEAYELALALGVRGETPSRQTEDPSR